MVRVLALTQLAFAVLGSMASIVLTRSQAGSAAAHAHEIRSYYASNFVWVLIVPIVWLLLAEGAVRFTSSEGIVKAVQASGILLAAAIGALCLWAVFGS